MSSAPASNTVRLHRVLRSTPERVYRAFVDGDALVKWLPPYGFTARLQQIDARVGGGYRMSFTNFNTGHSHSFAGTYLELQPGERLRYSNTFDNPHLAGEMVTTITLKAVSCGVELSVEQAGIPAAIPPDGCYLGWQESLQQLAALTEPAIP